MPLARRPGISELKYDMWHYRRKYPESRRFRARPGAPATSTRSSTGSVSNDSRLLLPSVLRPTTRLSAIRTFTSKVFEALNRELYDKYWNMSWSENTRVIGTEKADSKVKILSKIPVAVLHLVRKVELRYDFPGIESRDSLAHYFFDENGKKQHHNVRDLMRCFQWESQRIWSRIMRLWFENLKIIVTLRLDDLVLDLSQAYAPDGECVGVSVIAGSPRFWNGLPANLPILAPTQILVDRMRAIVERMNS